MASTAAPDAPASQTIPSSTTPASTSTPMPSAPNPSASKNKVQAAQGTVLTLHWLEKSRAQRALWLLEELNLEYNLKTYKRTKELLAPPELKNIHPLGKSPVIGLKTPGAKEETILAESGFFTEYLCEHFGKEFIPARWAVQANENFKGDAVGPDTTFGESEHAGRVGEESTEFMRYKYYLHYAEGSLMGAMVLKLVTTQLRNNSPKFITKRVANGIDSAFVDPNVKSNLAFIESDFKDNEYIAGKNVTAADFVIIYPLAAAWRRGIVNEREHPKIVAYIKRVESRPAFERSVQKIKDVFGSYDPTI